MLRVLLLALLVAPRAHAVELDALATCHTIEGRRPIDVRDHFDVADRQMYLWLRLHDADEIVLRWHRDGRFRVADRLRASGPRWTTWVRRRFRPGDVGQWRVEVIAGEAVIGEARFTVGGDDGAAPVSPSPIPPPVPPVAEPEPAAEPPAEPAPPAPIALTPPPIPDPESGCRALLNLRISEEDAPALYAVADVRFGATASIDHTTGLVVDDGERLHALAVRRRTHATRAWDELMSLPLRGDDPPRRWQRLPGAQPLPAPGRLREDNRLTVRSILGPYLGLHARLTGDLDDRPFDRSRFLTADPRGDLVDLRTVVGAGLEIMIGRHADPAAFDYRQIALVPEQGLVARFADKRIPLFAAPPRLRAVSPDPVGVFRNGPCAVKLAGHRIAASQEDAPFREVRAPGLLPYALLGVIWLDAKGPDVILPVERARQRFARQP